MYIEFPNKPWDYIIDFMVTFGYYDFDVMETCLDLDHFVQYENEKTNT